MAHLFEESLLEDAWDHVRAGGQAAGVDGLTLSDYESDLAANLSALTEDVSGGRYHPQAYRAVDIAKDSGGRRRIVIPTIRDRICMTAALLNLYPRLEPLLHPCSLAYRQGKGVHDALAMVAAYRNRGLVAVLRSDIASFFDSVDHALLFEQLAAAGIDEAELDHIRLWLSAPVITPEGTMVPVRGVPQGLPISPLLANLYLTPFDRHMVEAGWKMVRYADDLCICCTAEDEAHRAHAETVQALIPLRLTLSEEKTLISDFDSGFSFLGVRFSGPDILPEKPHPYERDFRPPSRPRRAPKQALPHNVLRTLYIQHQGSTLGCHGDRLVVRRADETLLDLPAHHVDQVFTFGRIHLTSAAMAFCLRKGIPVHLFSGRGSYYGALRTPGSDGLSIRRAQYQLIEDPERKLSFARTVVRNRIQNARTLLAQHTRNHPDPALEECCSRLTNSMERADDAESMEQLRGIEGAATALYYQGYARCFRGTLSFLQRTRRPPTDPVNSLISFAASLLYYNLSSYVAARNLDPAAGLFHAPGRGHMALVSDLMEEFRAPIAEALALAVCNRNEFAPGDFYRAPGNPQPCLLTDEARPRFINAFESVMERSLRHPDVEFEVNWRRILDLQVCRFRRFVEGAVDRYEPLRWE